MENVNIPDYMKEDVIDEMIGSGIGLDVLTQGPLFAQITEEKLQRAFREKGISPDKMWILESYYGSEEAAKYAVLNKSSFELKNAIRTQSNKEQDALYDMGGVVNHNKKSEYDPGASENNEMWKAHSYGYGMLSDFEKTMMDKGLFGNDYNVLKAYYGTEAAAINAINNESKETLDKILREENPFYWESSNGKLIQNQSILGDVGYGTSGTGAGNACGAIGAYNVCVELGIDVPFKEVYDTLSQEGTLNGGEWGTNPFKVKKFLEERPEVKDAVFLKDENEIGAHDSYILVYWGYDRRKTLSDIKWSGIEAHYQQFNEDSNGNLVLTNPDTIIDSTLGTIVSDDFHRDSSTNSGYNESLIYDINDYVNSEVDWLKGYEIIGIDLND